MGGPAILLEVRAQVVVNPGEDGGQQRVAVASSFFPAIVNDAMPRAAESQ